MKSHFIEDIREREPVDSVFLVRQKTTALAKNGKPYLTLKLMDRTGEIEARVWEGVEALDQIFQKNDFIQVRGKANVYLGKMQLVVQEILTVDEEAIDLADFLPVAETPIESMLQELRDQVDSLQDPHLKQMMELFLEDESFMRLFQQAPAAKTMHHVYLGGLMEHSLAVARLVDDVCQRYTGINRDLLLVGALLHDIGKTRELDYARSFDYTDEGKLVGHIVIGSQMVQEKIQQVEGFPSLLETLLQHLMLSHHGQYDYGSPKRPKTLEAVVLHFLDDMDAKINGVQSHLGREMDQEGDWSSYHRLYDRYFYKGASTKAKSQSDAPVAASQALLKSKEKPGSPKEKRRGAKDKPLGYTLADQLQGAKIDFFSVDEKDPS